jgi:hypothetical protein
MTTRLTTRPNARTRTRRLPVPVRLAGLALAALTGTVGLAACAGGGDAGGSSSDALSAEGRAAPPAAAAGAPQVDALTSTGTHGRGVNRAGAGDPVLLSRALIRTGAVELSSGDVEKAREQVVRVADRYAGVVDDEQSSTDERGDLAYTRLVLRIPSADYDAAYAAMQRAAHLDHAVSHTEDVTTELIDTTTRLRAERRSIARIEVLYNRANSIRNVIAIEQELARRQADLQSLERRTAYLRAQTAMSTLTVTIDRTATRTGRHDEGHHGFLAGLAAGWHSLSGTAGAVATAVGALLPWAVLAAVLAVPGVPLTRLVRRRLSAGRSGRTPSAA